MRCALGRFLPDDLRWYIERAQVWAPIPRQTARLVVSLEPTQTAAGRPAVCYSIACAQWCVKHRNLSDACASFESRMRGGVEVLRERRTLGHPLRAEDRITLAIALAVGALETM
jgi:hypothetical protein